MDAYLRWASTTGPSFVPAWTNADVVLASLAVFLACFTLSAFARRGWFFDIAFLAIVAGGILVSWPAMVALSIAAVFLAMVVSFIHRALRPEESARISAEAETIAAPGVESLTRELRDDRALRAGSQDRHGKEG